MAPKRRLSEIVPIAPLHEFDFNDTYQNRLTRDGYVVVPTPLQDPATRHDVRRAFLKHIRESSEFLVPTDKLHDESWPESDPIWKPVLGGFAAMGNRSSFHHPFVRKLREQMEAHLLEEDVLPLMGKKLENCFDRLMYRIPGETPTAEKWHRDVAKNAKETDLVFGGWVNLDDTSQFFSCVPKTHLEVGNAKQGFATIDKEDRELIALYKCTKQMVEIPAGHCLVFYERLVHEVLGTPSTTTMLRAFLGWRVTSEREPLFGSVLMNHWIDQQSVPLIKSGQHPRVWPSNYSNFGKNFETLTEWSKRTFVPELIHLSETVKSKDEEFNGTRWDRVNYHMESGAAFTPYDEHERALLWPSNRLNLYTFDSPARRVEFDLTPNEWIGYRAGKRAKPSGGTLLQPRPVRVEEDVRESLAS